VLRSISGLQTLFTTCADTKRYAEKRYMWGKCAQIQELALKKTLKVLAEVAEFFDFINFCLYGENFGF